jgi:hypothetical protein
VLHEHVVTLNQLVTTVGNQPPYLLLVFQTTQDLFRIANVTLQLLKKFTLQNGSLEKHNRFRIGRRTFLQIHRKAIAHLNYVVPVQSSILPFNFGEILLHHNFKHPHKLLVTAQLQLQLYAQHLLELRHTMLSQSNILQRVGHFSKRRHDFEAAAIDSLVQVDQLLPMGEYVNLFVKFDRVQEKVVAFDVPILQEMHLAEFVEDMSVLREVLMGVDFQDILGLFIVLQGLVKTVTFFVDLAQLVVVVGNLQVAVVVAAALDHIAQRLLGDIDR